MCLNIFKNDKKKKDINFLDEDMVKQSKKEKKEAEKNKKKGK